MLPKVIGIHGSSSRVTFELEDAKVLASGEFFAKEGQIAGFVVSMASLKFEDGTWLSDEEKKDLMLRYEEYVSQPHIQKKWTLEFE